MADNLQNATTFSGNNGDRGHKHMNIPRSKTPKVVYINETLHGDLHRYNKSTVRKARRKSMTRFKKGAKVLLRNLACTNISFPTANKNSPFDESNESIESPKSNGSCSPRYTSSPANEMKFSDRQHPLTTHQQKSPSDK